MPTLPCMIKYITVPIEPAAASPAPIPNNKFLFEFGFLLLFTNSSGFCSGGVVAVSVELVVLPVGVDIVCDVIKNLLLSTAKVIDFPFIIKTQMS